jgi:hypothetical protein
MTHSLPDGLYDQLLTDEQATALRQHVRADQRTLDDLDSASGTRRLAEALAEQLASVLQEIAPRQADDGAENAGKRTRLQAQLEFVNAMLVDLRKTTAPMCACWRARHRTCLRFTGSAPRHGHPTPASRRPGSLLPRKRRRHY